MFAFGGHRYGERAKAAAEWTFRRSFGRPDELRIGRLQVRNLAAPRDSIIRALSEVAKLSRPKPTCCSLRAAISGSEHVDPRRHSRVTRSPTLPIGISRKSFTCTDSMPSSGSVGESKVGIGRSGEA
jgi:hypothetical protein